MGRTSEKVWWWSHVHRGRFVFITTEALSTFWYLKSLFLCRMTMKILRDAQTTKRVFIGGKLKSLPGSALGNARREVCSGRVVVHLGERYRNGYTRKSSFVIYLYLYCAEVIRYSFYDDIKILRQHLTGRRQRWTDVEIFFWIRAPEIYCIATVFLLAFLLEDDKFPSAFDAEGLESYVPVRLPWRSCFLLCINSNVGVWTDLTSMRTTKWIKSYSHPNPRTPVHTN
jgi:hypothetical protein